MHRPCATYRLQMTPSFDFKEARDIVPYLHDLGISDVYLSPIFQAGKGSTHGYDVVDPTRINEELGGKEGAEKLHQELSRRQMGWLQDIVPNHMAFDPANVWLMDVLENGQYSRYKHYFDINWNHFYESLRGRVLAPFLGKFYGETLESGEISLAYGENGLTFNYYDLQFPMRIDSYTTVFTHNLHALEERLGEHHPDLMKFIGTVHTLSSLPGTEHINERYEQIRFTKRLLWELYSRNDAIREFIDNTLAEFNGDPDRPESFHLLDSLLGEQNFRLAFWKVATEEINYRRFFTINNLISLRIQDENVFADTHALVQSLIRRGIINGLRIDHIDGLHDPAQYLARLREFAPDTFLVVEKILERGERLPDDWPIAGTSGYDFLNAVNGAFCRTESEKDFTRLYHKFSRMQFGYDTLVAEKKRLIIDKHLAGNIDNLAHLMKHISSHDRHGNDITLYGLRRALIEIMAYFPAYRTYTNGPEVSAQDQRFIHKAVDRARDRIPDLSYEVDFIKKFLLLDFSGMADQEEKDQALRFVMRFQQVTGPLMAKGVEDTTMYVYNRLISLNEVGGSPNRFGSLEEFHAFNREAADTQGKGLNATATHDTKRGEDARARLNVLSEIPDEWDYMIREWRRLYKRRKTVRGVRMPDKNDEYLLYQALIAHWPLDDTERETFHERLKDYVIKAIREAKVHTAWLKPDADYENAALEFVENLLSSDAGKAFRDSFEPFCHKIIWHGLLNALSQVVLKITSPGVPDIYQGTEFWDFSMVDPDNRRPVDYTTRRKTLRQMVNSAATDLPGLVTDMTNTMYDGRIKFFTLYYALQTRRDHRDLFENGDYTILSANGPHQESVIAFTRRHNGNSAMIVVPRLTTRVVSENRLPVGRNAWNGTELELPEDAPGSWRNVYTNQSVTLENSAAVGDILDTFPVAILIRKET